MEHAGLTLKIRLAFMAIAAFMILFSLFTLNRMHALNEKSTEMEINWLPSVIVINAINTATSDYRVAEGLHVLTTLPEEIEKQERHIQRLLKEINELRGQYEKLISSEQERSIYQEFARKFQDYLTSSENALSYSRRNENENAAEQIKRSGILFNAFSTNLTQLVELNEHSAFETSKGGDQIFSEAQTMVGALNIVFIVFCFILLVLTEGWMSKAVKFIATNDVDKLAKVSFFNKITIKTKIRLSFLSIAFLFILFVWLALVRIELVNQKSTEIEVNWLPSTVTVNAINTATSDLRIAEATHILTTDNIEMVKREKEIEGLKHNIGQLRAKYEKLISSDEERNIYSLFSQKYEEYSNASDMAMNHSRRNENELAAMQLKQSGIIFHDMSSELIKLVELNNRGAEIASHEGDNILDLSITILMGGAITVLILSILMMLIFENMISHPLAQLTRTIQKLAKGDVSVSHTVKTRYDEIGYIAQAVDDITKTLEALINDSVELIQSAQSGVLSARVESDKHPGEFGVIISGMNQLLDVLSKPLVEVAEVMQKLALGNTKDRMAGAYEGELRALKANVNRSLDSLAGLLSELSEVTSHMAKNDLTYGVESNYQGDFAEMKTNVNHALGQMTEILKVVVSNMEHMSTATAQTVESANHVAEQSSNQMVSLDQIADSVSESSSTVTQIANNAKEGQALSSSTAELAAVGKTQLSKLVEIIEQMAGEYSRIEQITGKITRIADKTHLLSLNAGLEAVRAGEHGLGFGFVAQQIGKLAEEASLSARDIGTLIASSSQSVELSVNTAKQTQKAIEDITKAAQESGGAVQSISAAIMQQAATIEWIAEQVGKIQSSGQANATAAEEISNTMSQLATVVEHIYQQTQKFKLAS